MSIGERFEVILFGWVFTHGATLASGAAPLESMCGLDDCSGETASTPFQPGYMLAHNQDTRWSVGVIKISQGVDFLDDQLRVWCKSTCASRLVVLVSYLPKPLEHQAKWHLVVVQRKGEKRLKTVKISYYI